MIGKILEPWKYKLWLLYTTKQIRGIWHVKYDLYHPEVVDYTHPDNYIHYNIGINEWWATGSEDYLWVMHIPKDVAGLPAAALGAAIGAVIGFYATKNLIVTVIAAVIGAIAGEWIAGTVKDENDEGWFWIKDYKEYKLWGWTYAFQFDYKVGGICWFRSYATAPYYQPASWPLWYGWEPYLGLDGW